MNIKIILKYIYKYLKTFKKFKQNSIFQNIIK